MKHDLVLVSCMFRVNVGWEKARIKQGAESCARGSRQQEERSDEASWSKVTQDVQAVWQELHWTGGQPVIQTVSTDGGVQCMLQMPDHPSGIPA